MPKYNIWMEGFTAAGYSQEVTQLNEIPIEASSFENAVQIYIDARHLTAEWEDNNGNGYWTYYGLRLYPTKEKAHAK